MNQVNFKKKQHMSELYYQVSSESFRTQPDLVVEVLREMFPNKPCSTAVKTNCTKCSCALKGLLKEFIRKTREDSIRFKFRTGKPHEKEHAKGLLQNLKPNNYAKVLKQMKKKQSQELCEHDEAHVDNKEQQLVATVWFENFTRLLTQEYSHTKIDKKKMFKQFVNFLLYDEAAPP